MHPHTYMHTHADMPMFSCTHLHIHHTCRYYTCSHTSMHMHSHHTYKSCTLQHAYTHTSTSMQPCMHTRAHTQTKPGQCRPSFSPSCKDNIMAKENSLPFAKSWPQTFSIHVCPHWASPTMTQSKLCLLCEMNPPRGWPCSSVHAHPQGRAGYPLPPLAPKSAFLGPKCRVVCPQAPFPG